MAETVPFILQAATAAAAGGTAYKAITTKKPKAAQDTSGSALAAQQSNQIADQAESEQQKSALMKVRGRRGLLAYSQPTLAESLG